MRYYELDFRRVRLWEYARLAYPYSLSAAAQAWFWMKLGWSGLSKQVVLREESFEEGLIDLEQLPAPAKPHFVAASKDFASLGFADPVVQSFQSRGGNGQVTFTSTLRCRHQSGQFLAQAAHSFQVEHPGIFEVHVLTFTKQQRTIATSNGRKKFDVVPGTEATYHPDLPADKLFELHQAKIRNCIDSVSPMTTNADMEREVLGLSARYFDHMVRRGLMKEISSAAAEQRGATS